MNPNALGIVQRSHAATQRRVKDAIKGHPCLGCKKETQGRRETLVGVWHRECLRPMIERFMQERR